MIAVLVDSRNVGETSWTAARGCSEVLVRGMKKGDEVMIFLLRAGGEVCDRLVIRDCILPLPGDTDMVKVKHLRLGGGKVSVDMR